MVRTKRLFNQKSFITDDMKDSESKFDELHLLGIPGSHTVFMININRKSILCH